MQGNNSQSGLNKQDACIQMALESENLINHLAHLDTLILLEAFFCSLSGFI